MPITTREDGLSSGNGRRAATWLLAIVVAIASVVPLAATPASAACSTGALLGDTTAVDTIEASAQQRFVTRLNDLRRSHGKISLAWNGALATPGIAWSQKMSAQSWLRHARTIYGAEVHEDYVEIGKKVVPNWQRLAENVGRTSMYSSCTMTDLENNAMKAVDGLHNAFVNSSGHFANMVGDHNQVGIGVHIDHAEMWVTVRFAKGDLPTGSNAVAYTPVSQQTLQYIDAVYQVFANRTATSGDKSYWGPIVQSGDRRSLTTALTRADAWAGVRVNELYNRVLKRDADATGRRYWLDQIARGLQIQNTGIYFYASEEYFVANGRTNRSFVTAMYRDLLQRSVDGPGLAYWQGMLDRGVLSRSGVADNFYRSMESRRQRVVQLHTEVFGYGIGGSALDAWANRLAKIGDLAVSAEFAASDTYWSLATR